MNAREFSANKIIAEAELSSDPVSVLLFRLDLQFSQEEIQNISNNLQELSIIVKSKAIAAALLLGKALYEAKMYRSARKLLAESIALCTGAPDWSKEILQHATWSDDTEFSEEIPSNLQFAIEKFDLYIKRIMSLDYSEIDFGSGYSLWTIGRYWAKTKIKRVPLGDDCDVRQFSGYDQAFLTRKFAKEHSDFSYSDIDSMQTYLNLSKSDLLTFPPRMRDVIFSIKNGYKLTTSPFDGRPAACQHNVEVDVLWFIQSGNPCLVVQSQEWAWAQSDVAWFSPSDNFLFVTEDPTDAISAVARALCAAIERRDSFVSYLATDPKEVIIADFVVGHIGHYIWNVLSGWGRLFAGGHITPDTVIGSYTNHQLFGGVCELYQDQLPSSNKILRFESQNDHLSSIVNRNAFGLTVKDEHVTSELAHRVISWCRNSCQPESLDLAQQMRTSHDIICIITLRLGNRSWCEQETGLISLIKRIAEDNENVLFILDGLNSDAADVSSHSWMSLHAEHELAENIIRSCENISIHSSIGCSSADSIVLISIADVIISPLGAGLAKSRWICNKPGLVFSNRLGLAADNIHSRLYDMYRTDLVPLRYLDSSKVLDVGGALHGELFRSNFSLDWRDVYDGVKDFFISRRDRPDA